MRWLAALVALAALAVPVEARAYCRSTTTLEFNQGDPPKCDTEGKPLFWTSRCITMLVNRRASTKVSLATARTTLARSFDVWASASCDPCGAPGKPSIVGTEGGPTDCGKAYLRDGGTQTNTLVFYDRDWPNDEGQLALTTVTFKKDTGELVDADMEINATESISTTGAPETYDLESIITHEVGHVLGLAHSPDPTATMRPRYPTGDTTLRDLAQDDVCGICEVAPPGREAPCNATSGTCAAADGGTTTPETAVGNKADDPGYTCQCSAPGRAAASGWSALVLLAVSLLRSHNARRSRSRGSSYTQCSR